MLFTPYTDIDYEALGFSEIKPSAKELKYLKKIEEYEDKMDRTLETLKKLRYGLEQFRERRELRKLKTEIRDYHKSWKVLQGRLKCQNTT